MQMIKLLKNCIKKDRSRCDVNSQELLLVLNYSHLAKPLV